MSLNTFYSENKLNMYLNPKVHSSISTKGKKSTREDGREDHEVQLKLPTKYV
jgi:hypothetical protein